MKKITFEDNWQQFFAEFGLKTFDDFFEYSDAKTINKNNKRDVSILTLGSSFAGRFFFMKRFYKPHYKDVIAAWCGFGWGSSQAFLEWQNARLLLQNGINTYKPVLFGEDMKCGFEKRSILVTEKLNAQPMTEFVAENWRQFSSEEKEKLVTDLGGFVRRIHEAKISLPDLYLWHIFITQVSDKSCEFSVIDLHRMKRNVSDRNCQLRNLGRLDHSMTDKYFDEKMRQLLIKSYAGSNWPGSLAVLGAKVGKFSRAVSRKRNPKPY
ncbi:MAG: lipopolysaccharide kinase InaA family protein [Planctomycetota bacterium]